MQVLRVFEAANVGLSSGAPDTCLSTGEWLAAICRLLSTCLAKADLDSLEMAERLVGQTGAAQNAIAADVLPLCEIGCNANLNTVRVFNMQLVPFNGAQNLTLFFVLNTKILAT